MDESDASKREEWRQMASLSAVRLTGGPDFEFRAALPDDGAWDFFWDDLPEEPEHEGPVALTAADALVQLEATERALNVLLTGRDPGAAFRSRPMGLVLPDARSDVWAEHGHGLVYRYTFWMSEEVAERIEAALKLEFTNTHGSDGAPD